MIKKSILFSVLSILYLGLFAQDCKDYKWHKCSGYGDPYKYSGQSKSAFFEKGQSSDFFINTFGGFEYCISICRDKNLEGLYFRIRSDNVNRDILYDSSTETVDYLQKQFYVEETKKLIIEVIIPESMNPENERYRDRTGCVGVLIEYNKAPRKGF